MLARKQVQYFGEHSLHEREGTLSSGAQDVAPVAPAGPHLVSTAMAAELRITGQGSQRVPWHVDLGHDGNAPRRGVFHQPPDLRLGVVASVRLAVADGGGLEPRCGGAPGAHLVEARVRLDLEAPPVIVSEVPVKRVEFVEGHHVEESLDERRREEVPGHVEVEATPAEARGIGDLDGSQPLPGRQHLPRRRPIRRGGVS